VPIYLSAAAPRHILGEQMASNENIRKSAAREEGKMFWRATFALLAVLVLGIGSVAALALLTL
jgi:hypothetical protein